MRTKKSGLKMISNRNFINPSCAVRNSIVGMQCKAKNTAVHLYCEAFQRSNAPEYWIYGSTRLVPRKGLEPPRSYSLVPETSASTNSATWAFQERKRLYQK